MSKPFEFNPVAAPSMLSADFSKLREELSIVDPQCDWLHCDVMDGHFVPNLTFGPLLISAARKVTTAHLDVHLMMHYPQRMAEAFREAGADRLTIHVEARHDTGIAQTLAAIRNTGARTGLALKPGTPLEAAEPYVDDVDLLLIMTVEPGFGGQSFMEDQIPKIEQARTLREKRDARYLIEVDGGIDPATAPLCRRAGADVFVAGSAVFRAPDPAAALARLRSAIE